MNYICSIKQQDKRVGLFDTFLLLTLKIEVMAEFKTNKDGSITINPKDWVHVPEKSGYNNNFYRNKHDGSLIYERCDDEGGFWYYHAPNCHAPNFAIGYDCIGGYSFDYAPMNSDEPFEIYPNYC